MKCIAGVQSSFLMVAASLLGYAGSSDLVVQHGNSTIVLEPYAPNIIRVSLSLLHDKAAAVPGYGIVASPVSTGWKFERTSGDDVFHSSQLVVVVEGQRPPQPLPRTIVDISKFFLDSTQ